MAGGFTKTMRVRVYVMLLTRSSAVIRQGPVERSTIVMNPPPGWTGTGRPLTVNVPLGSAEPKTNVRERYGRRAPSQGCATRRAHSGERHTGAG